MEQDIIIRAAKEAEEEGLMALKKRAMRHGGREVYGRELMQAWTAEGNEVFEFYLAKHLLVAVSGEKILGFGGWRPELRDKLVARLASAFIEPGFEGRGLGGKLVEALLEDMRKAGFEMARLYASLNAYPFYLAQGFREVGRDHIPVAVGKKAEVVIMSKLL